MSAKWLHPAMVMMLATMSMNAAPTTRTGAKAPAVDYDVVAQRIVRECAGVQENDLVLVTGGSRDLEFLEDLAVQTRKLGAIPLLSVGSDRLIRRMYDDVPAQFDAQVPRWDLELVRTATVQIGMAYGDNPSLLAHVPPERMAAQSKAYQPVQDEVLKRNLRQVYLGNGLYPSAARAKQLGMTKEQLERIFWGGINVDYSKLQQSGKRVKQAFETGREVHITNPNGTDLTVQIAGRPVFVSDGVVSADDVRQGGAACQVWLPAGEVYLTPVPGTAEGTVVVDRQHYQGMEIVGLRIEFKQGRVVSLSAKSGLAGLKGRYDAGGEGKDEFSVIDVGINQNVVMPPGSLMETYMPAGMLTVNLGNNSWAGGENRSDFGWTCYLPGSTLTIDGRAMVKQGRLENEYVAAD